MIKTPLSTVIGGAFWTPSATILGSSSKNLTQLIKSLFSLGEQGFAYDPNDLTTLYQDVAGNIPVTAAGQPVGLMLDKSKGLALGGELFIDSNVSLTHQATRISAGYYNISSTADTSAVQTNITGEVKWRVVEYEITRAGSGSIRIDYASGVNIALPLTLGRRKVYIYGDRINFVRSATPTDIDFKIYSIKELHGNHAYQTTSSSRPILQQTPILAANLLPTYDFRTWTVTGAPNPLTANSFTTAASGGVQTAILKPNTSYVIELDIENTSNVNVYHGAGANTSFTSGTRRKVTIQATTDNGAAFYFRNATAGTTTVYSIKVQEVTGYRTDQNYLAFDGADDFLQTNNIDFTATDKVSLFAGVRKLSDTSTGIICENASFYIAAPTGAGSPTVGNSFKVSTLRANSLTNYPAPIDMIVTSQGDVSASTSSIRINGMNSGTNTGSQGVGNYSNSVMYIGRRAGTVAPFNGHLYSLIGIGRLTSDSETKALEKSIAKNTGVTLNV